MIVVVLPADGPTPPGLDRLLAQLDALPDRVRARVRTPTSATFADLAGQVQKAAENGEGLAVVAADLVVADHVLRDVLEDSRSDRTDGLLVLTAADAGPAAEAWRLAAGSQTGPVDVAMAGGVLDLRRTAEPTDVPMPARARPSLGVLKKSLRRTVAVPVIRLLMLLTPPSRVALVAGLPDREENSLVTAVALAGRYSGDVVLVADDPATAQAALDHVAALLGRSADRVRIVGKRGLATFWIFVRAQLVFYTHGLYDSPRPVRRRLHVNLWHGTGPKWNANANFAQRIGAQAHSASSPLWGAEAMRALSMGADVRIVAGNPRQDVVAAATDRGRLAALGLAPDRPMVLWLPTFRSSTRAGLVGLDEGEPIGADAGRAFAAAAAQHGVQLVAKPHRLDSAHFEALGVTVLTDEQIRAAGLTLYELLAHASGLLSDYSSVWVDLLDRPVSIALYLPDLARYQRDRGLNRPDLGVAAAGLTVDETNADEFFAAVAAGRIWRPDARQHCIDRIEYVDLAPGERTATMLDQLAMLAQELFADDLGLGVGER